MRNRCQSTNRESGAGVGRVTGNSVMLGSKDLQQDYQFLYILKPGLGIHRISGSNGLNQGLELSVTAILSSCSLTENCHQHHGKSWITPMHRVIKHDHKDFVLLKLCQKHWKGFLDPSVDTSGINGSIQMHFLITKNTKDPIRAAVQMIKQSKGTKATSKNHKPSNKNALGKTEKLEGNRKEQRYTKKLDELAETKGRLTRKR